MTGAPCSTASCSGAQCSTLKGRRPAQQPAGALCSTGILERVARQIMVERYARHYDWRPAQPPPRSVLLNEIRRERNAQPSCSGAQCSTLKGRRPAQQPDGALCSTGILERIARQIMVERYAQHQSRRPARPSSWSSMLNKIQERDARLRYSGAQCSTP